MSALAPASRRGGWVPLRGCLGAGKQEGKAHLYIIPIILNILLFLGFCSLLISEVLV